MDSPLTTPELIGAAARRHPERACVVVEGNVLTHRDVDEQATAVAAALAASGLGRGRRVAILGPNHLLTLVATVGILRAGAAWIPLNPRDSVESITDLCRRFRTDAVVYHDDFAAALPTIRAGAPTLATEIPLTASGGSRGGLLEWAEAHRAPAALPAPALDDLAVVFATGGTTGAPKGVCYHHATLAAIVRNYGGLLDHPDPVFLAAGPLTHVSGRISLAIMAAGGTTVVLPQFDARAALEAIERHRVTTMMLPTTMLARMLADPAASSIDVSSLRWIAVGAAPVSIDLIKRAIDVFGPVVGQTYSQTEAPTFITVMHPADYFSGGELVDEARLASCGRPTPFADVRLVGDDDRDVPVGAVGEILVRGEFVMDGYLDDPDATAAATLDGYHRTGDLATVDADGFFAIVGRRREIIITGGFNVYPAEVENVLADRPEVLEAAVIGLPDADWGERVVAVVEPVSGAVCDADELRRYLRQRLGGVKAPKEVVFVDSLPRNANGKILKRLLVEELAGTGASPRTGLAGRGSG